MKQTPLAGGQSVNYKDCINMTKNCLKSLHFSWVWTPPISIGTSNY